jgi:two-component system OmpR family sensor kinase
MTSIRGTLLLWYGAILVAVVGAFGGFVIWNQRSSAIGAVDAELQAYARAIVGAVEVDDEDGLEFELDKEYAAHFPEDRYYIIWKPNGKVLARSKGAPKLPKPSELGTFERDGVRTLVVGAAGDSVVLFARDIRGIRRAAGQFAAAVVVAGSAALALAMLGGWFLAGRVLRPIDKISRAAEAISETNLAERIDAGRTESELGRLARTLNDTFTRLQAAFERQTRFTADASHELRTPLSVVTTNAELALRKDRTPAEYREALEACLRAAKRMRGVVEGLLALARSDAGEARMKRERVELDSLTVETVDMLKPLADKRKVSLLVDADPVEVTGDPDRLREMLTNLATNAILYNRQGGSVEVELRRRNGEASLSVTDTGIGIPEKDQPRMFERFFRVDPARSREQGGSGLGLSITKWIVEAHGGRIEFESRQGEGTRFTVRLPVGADREE